MQKKLYSNVKGFTTSSKTTRTFLRTFLSVGMLRFIIDNKCFVLAIYLQWTWTWRGTSCKLLLSIFIKRSSSVYKRNLTIVGSLMRSRNVWGLQSIRRSVTQVLKTLQSYLNFKIVWVKKRLKSLSSCSWDPTSSNS